MTKKVQLNNILNNKSLLKVISGMENFDKDNIKTVVNSAVLGGANAVDISSDYEMINWVKENHSELILFVSSLSIESLLKAKENGADVLELGNFDALYSKGKSITKEEIINLTRELRSRVGKDTVLCITVPGNVSIKEQIDVALQLQAAGADILQIENLNYNSDYKNAVEIVKIVEIPVILSGKIDSKKVEKAISTGVNGIGIGNAIRNKGSLHDMTEEVKSLMKVLNKELFLV
jgi:thiamine monophosphate synthase